MPNELRSIRTYFSRLEFDQDDIPDLTSEVYLQDIHSISSLLKMYFRELPNPLLTYQLYNKFSVSFSFQNKSMKETQNSSKLNIKTYALLVELGLNSSRTRKKHT